MKKILSLALLITLTGCAGSDVKNTLGLKKKAPDEFMVMSHPALTVPPSFELPEPQSQGSAAPKDFSTNNAKQAVFGESKNTTVAAPSTKKGSKKAAADNLFLNKAGVEQNQGNIRTLLEEDVRATEDPQPEDDEQQGFFSRLFSPIELDETPDPIVSPAAEKQRIKDAKAQGKKVDGEDAATIQPKGESVLNKIIGK